MSALALVALIALGQKKSVDTTGAIEGVWVDTLGNVMFAGNGRIDYNIEDRYYSAMVAQVPDGSWLGPFSAGRGIDISLDTFNPKTATEAIGWSKPVHLGPVAAGLAKVASFGEVRVTPGTRSGSGLIAVAYLDSKASTSTGSRYTLIRAMPFDSFTIAGKFADKDLTLEISEPAGRTAEVHGTLTYLGAKRSISGRRIMGRASFLTFVDSRLGPNGSGYIVWTPSLDRIPKLRERETTQTDRITVHFDLSNGGTAAGIDKILTRVP